MKVIGTLDTKDDGDILQDVLDHIEGVDTIFAYNDGSIDNTEDILKNHPLVSKYVNRSDFPEEIHISIPQHRRHHLLQMVMNEYSTYNTEEIWIVRLEGDRFLMNSDYKDICAAGLFYELSGVCGVMVDCRLDPSKNWKNFDTWPNWHKSITKIQTWGRIDDVHPVVAFKVEDGVKYSLNKPRPWPVIWGPTDYHSNDLVTTNMPFFAHHGRRGPRYWSWAYGTSGSRKPSEKWPKSWDFSSPETAYQTVHGVPFRPDGLIQLISAETHHDYHSNFSYYSHYASFGADVIRSDIKNLCNQWNALSPRNK